MGNSFNDFRELVTAGNMQPARSNMYSVEIGIPPVLTMTTNKWLRGKAARKFYSAMNYLADDVTVPGRRITTSQVRDIGAMRHYATDTAFAPITCSFLVTKDMYHREFFERWMNFTATDAENRATFYQEYITEMRILKWEMGSNALMSSKVRGSSIKQNNQQIEIDPKGGSKKEVQLRLNRTTAVWQMYGCYPFDMSAITLNNGPADILKLDISFRYERYRFDTISMNTAPFGKGRDVVYNAFDNALLGNLGINSSQTDVAQYGT